MDRKMETAVFTYFNFFMSPRSMRVVSKKCITSLFHI